MRPFRLHAAAWLRARLPRSLRADRAHHGAARGERRYWISGQANSIFQMHGHFRSPYEGTNSLQRPLREQGVGGGNAVSRVINCIPTRATTPT